MTPLPSSEALARLRAWRGVQRASAEVQRCTQPWATMADLERACRGFLAAMTALDGCGGAPPDAGRIWQEETP